MTAYAGPSFFIASIVFGFPLLLVSMDVWQRIYAALDARTARRAFFFAGFLKVGVILASVLLGFLAYHLVPGVEKDLALYTLMQQLLPPGILGLGYASILAILMSTIDSELMVGSATITKDVYMVHYPRATSQQQVRVGRLAVLFFGAGAFIVALQVQDIVRLAVASVQILSVFAPALLGGLLWARSSARGAFWSILLGFFTTLGFLPFMPDTAFIPGLLLAIILFLTFSLSSRQT